MTDNFNLPLLRKAVDWAIDQAARPERECEWYQGAFALYGAEIGRTCGTAFCIAGYVTELSEPGWFDRVVGAQTFRNPSDMATEALGITKAEAWTDPGLFKENLTIEQVQRYAAIIAKRHGETW